MPILDTCAFVWLALDPDRLSAPAAAAIAGGELAIASITFLELGYLQRKGRLDLGTDLDHFVELTRTAHGITVRPLTPTIVDRAMALPDEINADPADRVICATAIAEDDVLITADGNLIASAAVRTIW